MDEVDKLDEMDKVVVEEVDKDKADNMDKDNVDNDKVEVLVPSHVPF